MCLVVSCQLSCLLLTNLYILNLMISCICSVNVSLVEDLVHNLALTIHGYKQMLASDAMRYDVM
jgi:hypothetical protein